MPDGDIFFKSIPYHFRRASRFVFGVEDYDLAVEECVRSLVQQLNEWSCPDFGRAVRIIADAERSASGVVGRRQVLDELNSYIGAFPRRLLDAMQHVANRRIANASLNRRVATGIQGNDLETQIASEVLSHVVVGSIATARLLSGLLLKGKMDEQTFRERRNEMALRLPATPMMLRIADQMMRAEGSTSRTISAPRSSRPTVNQGDLIHMSLD